MCVRFRWNLMLGRKLSVECVMRMCLGGSLGLAWRLMVGALMCRKLCLSLIVIVRIFRLRRGLLLRVLLWWILIAVLRRLRGLLLKCRTCGLRSRDISGLYSTDCPVPLPSGPGAFFEGDL